MLKLRSRKKKLRIASSNSSTCNGGHVGTPSISMNKQSRSTTIHSMETRYLIIPALDSPPFVFLLVYSYKRFYFIELEICNSPHYTATPPSSLIVSSLFFYQERCKYFLPTIRSKFQQKAWKQLAFELWTWKSLTPRRRGAGRAPGPPRPRRGAARRRRRHRRGSPGTATPARPP